MPSAEILEFAETLIREVRDRAIANCDMNCDEDAKSAEARRWKSCLSSESVKELVDMIIADCVDETIACLLYAIDDGVLPLTFSAENGRPVDLEKDGQSELTGWYMGTGGWREAYSKERFNDDFSDLKDWPPPEILDGGLDPDVPMEEK